MEREEIGPMEEDDGREMDCPNCGGAVVAVDDVPDVMRACGECGWESD